MELRFDVTQSDGTPIVKVRRRRFRDPICVTPDWLLPIFRFTITSIYHGVT